MYLNIYTIINVGKRNSIADKSRVHISTVGDNRSKDSPRGCIGDNDIYIYVCVCKYIYIYVYVYIYMITPRKMHA
jgi:hypothetical protein